MNLLSARHCFRHGAFKGDDSSAWGPNILGQGIQTRNQSPDTQGDLPQMWEVPE